MKMEELNIISDHFTVVIQLVNAMTYIFSIKKTQFTIFPLRIRAVSELCQLRYFLTDRSH